MENSFSEKLNGKQPEELARKFNFQNIDSIKKAFKFLFEGFDDDNFYSIANPKTFYPFFDCKEIIKDMLNSRHKIIHEGFYDKKLGRNEFELFSYCSLNLVENYNDYFESKGFYKIENK